MTSFPNPVFDLLVLVPGLAAVYPAFRELFITIPGVHTARWHEPWSTPKFAALVVLLGAVLVIVAAILLLFIIRNVGTRRIVRVLEIAGLLALVIAWVTWVLDFLNNAGRFG